MEMNPGMIGGVAGGVIGIVGGLIGTFFSIKNTSGPRERALTIRASIICWIAVLAFLALFFLVPSPWNLLLWLPYGVLLPLGIIRWNKAQQRIREEESQNKPS
jgi:drug/metabolite transporter (DMT)-like permease